MRWSQRDIAYLISNARLGAALIAAHLHRSVHAVEVQASRYGVSLRRWWLCPRCARKTYSPLSKKTGWCRSCSAERAREQAVIRNREIKQEKECEKERMHEKKQAVQAEYSETYRLRK